MTTLEPNIDPELAAMLEQLEEQNRDEVVERRGRASLRR